jgi:23S rRNA (guanine745-N1)-methyltransferase
MDGSPLDVAPDGALRCAEGHSYDRAREGYYNLLVVQHKASKDPGDTKEMVAARRRVLDAGYYAPVAEGVIAHFNRLALERDPGTGFSIVDAGCGEGYYLDAIAQAASAHRGRRFQLAGIDISKWAVRAAAKRNAVCFWAVATNRHLPFAPGSADLILSMFGFAVWDSFAALQSPGGHVLLADPGPNHLIELRSVIYPAVRATTPQSIEVALRAGYVIESEQRLEYSFELHGSAAIGDLLTMTPHDHRAPRAGREALAALNHLALTGDVVLRLLRREG